MVAVVVFVVVVVEMRLKDVFVLRVERNPHVCSGLHLSARAQSILLLLWLLLLLLLLL